MKKKLVSFFLIPSLALAILPSENATSINSEIVTSLGTCSSLYTNLAGCIESSCVKPYQEVNGAWYTIIIKGMNPNNKCYTVSYAFLNDKIVSEVEHCWYDKENLKKATDFSQKWSYARSATVALGADSDWAKLRYKVCKKVITENK